MSENINKKTILYTFCKYLISSETFIDMVTYNKIIYEDRVTRTTTYDEDIEYLIDYHKINGQYPSEFQVLFNEFILERL